MVILAGAENSLVGERLLRPYKERRCGNGRTVRSKGWRFDG